MKILHLSIKLSLYLICSLILSSLNGLADEKKEARVPRHGDWVIIDYVGDARILDEESLIGETQQFYKAYAEGPFINCTRVLSSYTQTYKIEEFFSNKEFIMFKNLNIRDKIKAKRLFVERTFCPENGQQMYPFVQTGYRKAFYLLGGAIFIMEPPKR